MCVSQSWSLKLSKFLLCAAAGSLFFLPSAQGRERVVFPAWSPISIVPSTGLNPPTLPSPDSCLFSPTLSRDLIEGNHSDKKPPTIMLLCFRVHGCLCTFMCVWEWEEGWGSSFASITIPTTSFPLSLSLPPLKCHAALSTRLPCYSPQHAFCIAQRRGTEAEREWQRGQREWERASSCCCLVVSDLWERLLNIRRAGVLPKALHFSLISAVLLAPQPPWPHLILTHITDLCVFFFNCLY